MNKHSNFGFSSILLAFVMMCILTFSALALLSANSDWQLSKKAVSNNTAYYEAEAEAYRILAQVDYALLSAYSDSTNEESYYQLVMETVPGLCGGELLENNTGYELSYEISQTDSQTLRIRLSIRYPNQEAQNFYDILEWKTVHESSYVEEEPLHLMGSGDE